MKFLVPNYSCIQNPWLGGYRPQIPVLSVLCPQLILLNPHEQNSWVRHCIHVNINTHRQIRTLCFRFIQTLLSTQDVFSETGTFHPPPQGLQSKLVIPNCAQMFRQLYTNFVWKSNSWVLMKLSSPTWKNERPLFGQMFNIALFDAGRVLGRRHSSDEQGPLFESLHPMEISCYFWRGGIKKNIWAN